MNDSTRGFEGVKEFSEVLAKKLPIVYWFSSYPVSPLAKEHLLEVFGDHQLIQISGVLELGSTTDCFKTYKEVKFAEMASDAGKGVVEVAKHTLTQETPLIFNNLEIDPSQLSAWMERGFTRLYCAAYVANNDENEQSVVYKNLCLIRDIKENNGEYKPLFEPYF